MKKTILAAIFIIVASSLFANPLIGKWKIEGEDYEGTAEFKEQVVRITSVEDDEVLFWQYHEENKILIIESYMYKIKFITPDKFQLGQAAVGKEWMEGIMFTFTRIKEEQTNGI